MADKIIEVPGVGNVAFPETMSDDQISAAIRAQVAGKSAPAAPQGGAVSRGVSNWWQEVNPVTQIKGLAGAIAHPVDTMKGMGEAQDALRVKALDAYNKGDYTTAAAHALHYLIPVLGPALDKRGEQAASGDVAGAVGGTLGIATNLAAPELLKGVPVRVAPRLANPNRVEAAAAEWGERAGVPVDLATATGNKAVAGVQQAAEYSPAGSLVSQAARREQTRALTAASERLAERAYPQPVVPEQAGKAVVGALESKTEALKAVADAAYDGFRRVEALPRNLETVQIGMQLPSNAAATLDGLARSLAQKSFDRLTKEQQSQVVEIARKMGISVDPIPITKQIPLPVDMRPIKEALEPVVADMETWLEPAKRHASKGFTAAKSIVDGPDFMQASTAEKGLGGLKALAREATSPAMRDVNAGMGAHAAKLLQDAIDAKVAAAGDDAIYALKLGRSKHAAKMEVGDVLDSLREEPVQAFNQAIYAKDSGIEQLRKVAKHAPSEMPKVGRAYLEDLLGKATARGGFDSAGSIWKSWSNLGPETKKILFKDPLLVKDLDNMFLLAKKMAERPNTSGSAVVGGLIAGLGYVVSHPIKGTALLIAGGPLTRMLYSPKAVKALTQGLRVQLGNKAAAALTANQILKLAGEDAQPLQLPAPGDSISFPGQRTGQDAKLPGQQ